MTPRPKPKLGTQVLIGVLIGILVGVFLGDWAAPLDYVGRAYISLLQMTVLPYITVSLISKIGGLAPNKLKVLAGQAGLVMLGLWGISLVTVFLMPLSLPDWGAGHFFSSSLVERPEPVDFLSLYLPKNPFHALANNVVPAVVVFSIFIGVALIFTPRKTALLDLSQTVSDTLGLVSNFIIRLSPWGTFALTAASAGTLSPSELLRLSGYVSTFTIAVLFLALVVLPSMAAALTPYRYRDILSALRNSILTAFATGKLFAVLPLVMQDVKNMLMSQGLSAEDAEEDANLYVPIAYPFPNAGKILGLLFIPFAAWFIGAGLEPGQYVMLLPAGLFAFFGSPVAAIPFLLDMMRLPSDLLPLFLVAGIWCARMGDTLGAVHLGVFSLICSAWSRGGFSAKPSRLLTPIFVVSLFGVGAIGANYFIVRASLPADSSSSDIVADMQFTRKLVDIQTLRASSVNPATLRDGETRWERILRTKKLRVAYVPKSAPYSYKNRQGDVVGFDIDFIQHLAADCGATLVLMPVTRRELARGFREDHYDLAVGEIASKISHHGQLLEAGPYLQTHAAFVVPDHRVSRYRSLAVIRSNKTNRVAHEASGLILRTHRFIVPGVERIEIQHAEDFLEGREPEVDVLITTAERGSVMTMLYPRFSVVIPEGVKVQIPLVIAVAQSKDLQETVNTWIRLKKSDGTINDLYNHWILGKHTERKKKKRWSVIRDLLGWVD